jgi:hypothetical protein
MGSERRLRNREVPPRAGSPRHRHRQPPRELVEHPGRTLGGSPRRRHRGEGTRHSASHRDRGRGQEVAPRFSSSKTKPRNVDAKDGTDGRHRLASVKARPTT